MGGKTKAPPPPDYTPIAMAQSQAAAYSAQLGQQQLEWAKEQYAQDSARLDKNEATWDKVIQDNFHRQDALDEQAKADRARYEAKFQPLEDQLIGEAGGYTDQRNQARAEAAAGRAAGDVSQQAELARSAAQDRLESFGIDPTQTRSQALDIAQRTQEAAARTGAANQARDQTRLTEEATGRALRSEALNIGRGYPGQIAQDYGLALQSGAGASGTAGQSIGAGLSTTASGAATMGTPIQWQGQSQQALQGWGNTLNTGYNNQLAAAKFKADQSTGWGSALGLIGGIGLRAAMTPAMGPGGSMLGSLLPRFAEGGAVQDEGVSHQGIPVTPRMSPSRGVEVDDVPARLTAGEFVVPKEAVNWFGEKHFQKLIEKAQEEKAEARAKPRMAIPVEPNPAAASRNPNVSARAAMARDPYGMHAQNDILAAQQTQDENAGVEPNLPLYLREPPRRALPLR